MKYIRYFNEINLNDIGLVGGKNASLGQLIQDLSGQNISVPFGFALTSAAYWRHLDAHNLREKIGALSKNIDIFSDEKSVAETSKQIRSLISNADLPEDIRAELAIAYKALNECTVAVRSSATAEDLPDASFAGQQDSYLNITGSYDLEEAIKNCMASLFTERAMLYRREKKFDDMSIALSVGVQKMIRSDKACSGVMFTLDTETGFKDLIVINGSYGLGEALVQGTVTPDEFYVHKPTLQAGFSPLIKKELGSKELKHVYGSNKEQKIVSQETSAQERLQFCLTDSEVLSLARMALTIEEHYSALKGSWSPMDIEWAKDGIDGKLYIVQARPETVHGQKNQTQYTYRLIEKPAQAPLITGQAIGQKISSGTVRLIESLASQSIFNQGDILVTRMTDPDWLPLMRKAGGIITDQGGRTCHAAIISRELGIPAIIGTKEGTSILRETNTVTLDCSNGSTGFVYSGTVAFEQIAKAKKSFTQPPVKILLNLGNPSSAFTYADLPVEGIGLARLEFIMSSQLGFHPLALINKELVKDASIQSMIEAAAYAYNKNAEEFFISKLAQGIGTLAAAFYPKQVIVRFSDFKSNEYKNLLGGNFFEPEEENPMIGFRGASRYLSSLYKPAFALECAALKRARELFGLTNIACMIPFVRTVHEAAETGKLLEQNGLKRGENGLKVIMMCELPANVLLIDEFAKYFDGFSIGSNDLTQLTLGVDRDSAALAELFDERDPAVTRMIALAIMGAHEAQTPIGICGQGPSDYPEFADFLIQLKIDSLSLNPDSVVPFLERFNQ